MADIETLRDELNAVISRGEWQEILRISQELDIEIVDFMKKQKVETA